MSVRTKPHHQGTHLVVPYHLIICDHGAPPNRCSLQTTPFRIAGELKEILTARPMEQLPELLEGFELCYENGLENDTALVKANVHLARTMTLEEVSFRRHLRHNADVIFFPPVERFLLNELICRLRHQRLKAGAQACQRAGCREEVAELRRDELRLKRVLRRWVDHSIECDDAAMEVGYDVEWSFCVAVEGDTPIAHNLSVLRVHRA
jgi:hypothetical protein